MVEEIQHPQLPSKLIFMFFKGADQGWYKNLLSSITSLYFSSDKFSRLIKGWRIEFDPAFAFICKAGGVLGKMSFCQQGFSFRLFSFISRISREVPGVISVKV